MKILYEAIGDNGDYDIYVSDDGTFYYYNGHAYKQVPGAIESELRRQYADFKRFQEMQEEDPSLTYDEYKRQDLAQRRQYDGSVALKGLEAERKAKQQQALEVQRKVAAYKKTNVFDASVEVLAKDIKDFMDTALAPQVVPNFYNRYSYQRPNSRYAGLDSTIIRKGRTKYKQFEELPDQELPLVLFYFDRSGSFSPKRAPEKTQLGKDIQAMFSQYEQAGQIAVKTFYFTPWVYDTESEALHGNVGAGAGPFLEHIKQQTAGRVSNVVILTDSDSRALTSDPVVEIEGSVWIVCANSTPNNLEKHFKLVSRDSLLKIYHFSGLDANY